MRTKENLRRLVRLREAALTQSPVEPGIHNFYRYPARFPPGFAGAAIEAFTRGGDFVLDPFVGGGTSLVEAQILARRSAGFDINPLAVLVSKAKTTLYSPQALRQVRLWQRELSSVLDLRGPAPIEPFWKEHDYLRNFDSQEAWALRKFILQATGSLDTLPPKPRLLARCALLRSAQWALDLREKIPSAQDFRIYLGNKVEAMADAAEAYRRQVRTRARELFVHHSDVRPLIIQIGCEGAANHPRVKQLPKPALVLTSPPYPGVYVLYHRWKIRARKETPFPFVIANSLDGRGIGHYIWGWRQQHELKRYFENLRKAFESLARIIGPKTWVCQMVGFSDPTWQLSRYLHVMQDVGFEEHLLEAVANCDDGRLWRSVPGRRWFAKHQEAAQATAREVVLFHRLQH